MSATWKQRVTSNGATEELWCVADAGEVEKLERILERGVDVNACNEHGMTALMRAANQGHVQMVRALLRHGADPNVMRNDKFTALALAAFFGHTETVRVLIEHGAKSEVVTRFGTSPQMWAAARTYNEAARYIEKPPRVAAATARVVEPAPAPVPAPAPAQVPTLVPAAGRAPVRVAAPVEVDDAPEPVAAPTTIRTLKDPPEIWELVHPVPQKRFTAGSAFMSNLMSMNGLLSLGAVIVFLAVVVGMGMFVFKGAMAGDQPREVRLPVKATVAATTTAPPSTVVPASGPTQVQAANPVTAPPPPAVESAPVVEAPVIKKTWAPRPPRIRPSVNEAIVEAAPSRETPVAVVTPNVEKPRPVDATPKNAARPALSPTLVAPAQNAPPKAKVIQWP